MTLVQRKFAVSLIMLLILSLTSYTGQATQQMPEGCDGDGNLATKIQDCLKREGIEFQHICITKDRIEVVLKAGIRTPVACSIVTAIRECVLLHTVGAEPNYEFTISVAPSTPGGAAQLVYKGHTGTGTDPDSMPCVDVLALISKGTLNIKTDTVERKVSVDARTLGVSLDRLQVVAASKCNDGRSCLQVSGIASASGVSATRVRGIVVVLVSKYTGVLRINTDKFEVRINADNFKATSRRGKVSRIK